MNPNNYFKIADYLVKSKGESIPEEIFFRTAINRLYYGIFHLVQLELGILIPKSQINRCHAYVKEQIQDSKLRSDYSDLEVYRVEVDYKITNLISYNDYNDAQRIQQRILNTISEPEHLPYNENDEDFYFKTKK